MKKFLVLVTLMAAFAAYAGETVQSLRQNRWSILTDEEFSLQYKIPGFPYGTHDEFNTAKVKLVYNREAQSDITFSTDWRYTVKFKFYDNTNTTLGAEQTLVLERAGASYIYSDYALLDISAYTSGQIKIKITGVIGEYNTGGGWTTASNPDVNSNIPGDIHLELSVRNERYFELNPAKTVRLFMDENPNDIELRWNYAEGAEEYDLEWVYIDEQAAEYASLIASIGGTYDPALAFTIKEPTSVRVNYNTYKIDKTFPTGAVFFRVRPVGRHIGTGVSGDYTYIHEGAWNYYSVSPFAGETGSAATLAYLVINTGNDFEAGKSWIYSVGFSENGKFASGVSYADGSNRVRQGTAYNSTNDITLKSESKYDYEGRQVVALAPAPVGGRNLAYDAGFNTVSNGTEVFNKQHFDIANPAQLDNTSGISQYFSENNAFVQENGGAIPDVNGYAYGQVRYKKDGSGRPVMSGGVGETFQVDGNQAIRYYYGSPTYVEMKRLFGSDVSDNNNYYRKNMVEDANGQLSVTYTDGSGRTIATALAGLPPNNLVPLDGSVETYTTALNTGNIYTNNGQTLESNFQFINTVVNNNLTLTYNFDGIIFEYTDLGASPKCKDCEYTLEITIIDPDGIETTHTETVSYASFTTCPATYDSYFPVETAAVITDTYTCTQIGEYKIIKRLTVDVNNMLGDVTAGLTNSTVLTNLINSYLFDADLSGCYTDPLDYCTYLAEYNYDQANGQGTFDALTQAAKETLIADCYGDVTATDELFDGDAEEIANSETPVFATQCDAYLYAIEQQISPGGAVYTETVASSFWTDVAADLGTTLLLYETYIAGVGQGAAINTVSYLQTPANFQTEWLPLLAPYHREYCHYQLCDEAVALMEFDMTFDAFMQTETGGTFSDAEVNFLWGESGTNPDPFLASVFDPGTALFGMLDNDFNTSTLPTNPPDACECNPSTTPIDLYAYIDALSNCKFACSGSYFTTTEKFTILKGIYMDAKQQLIDDYKTTQSCSYFNDDYAIFKSGSDFSTVVDSNEPGADDFVNNTYDNTDFFVPDVLAVCANNVTSWINSLPASCIDALTTAGTLDNLEAAFTAYCENYCNSVNPGGWFFDHQPGAGSDTYYDAVMTILNGACPGLPITFETTAPTTDVLDGVVDQNFPPCYLHMMDYINTVVLPDTPIAADEYHYGPGHPLNNCGSQQADAYWIVEGDGAHLTESDDTAKLCENFFAVQNLGSPYNDYALNTVSNIHNLFKHANGDVTAYAYISGVLKEVKIIYVANGCYDPGVFTDMEIITDLPAGLDITYPNWEADCIQQVQDAATQNATNAYNNLIENGQNNFLLNIADCFEGINEVFEMQYNLYEYQYTLFYYDQAGNLVQTIPPAGVVPVPSSHFVPQLTAPYATLWDGTEPQHDAFTFTMYTYNGANMLVESQTPDGGITKYYYDELLRPRFVQNAQQLVENKFSYTVYDNLGRPTEAGEAGDPGFATLNFMASVNDYSYPTTGLKRDYIKTYYESIYTPDPTIENAFTNGQQNLINAVGAVEKRTADYVYSGGTLTPAAGTIVQNITSFSYDAHGNANEVVQTNTHLESIGHGNKLIQYDYDLISGNVEEVAYQKNEMDEWRHRYQYDAANRLVRAWTSDDGEEWEMDAKYIYYIHGSLARVERGEDNVQGTDYAYTDQGWLKGANGTYMDVSKDLGQDGHSSGLDKYAGADAFGYALGYFNGDYTSNAANTWFASTTYLMTENGAYGSLYNGNITHMVTAMKDENETRINITGNNYTYDLLQRLKSMDVYQVTAAQYTDYQNSGFTTTTAPVSNAYAEAYTYDKNGNIQTLQRYDQSAVLMDNFAYTYNTVTGKLNQLNFVYDNASASAVTSDIDYQSQASNNYTYDLNGQLITDADENITDIDWTADGKVRKITQSDNNTVEFVYDAGGNRTMKVEKGINYVGAVYTYYVYDAGGNLMATYTRSVTALNDPDHGDNYIPLLDELYLSEKTIYGTGRLGVKNENRKLSDYEFDVYIPVGGFYSLTGPGTDVLTNYPQNFEKTKRRVGEKYYELSNHLNNVLEVVTDRKLGNTGLTAYEADIISYSDYYPFGMVMPGRNGNANNYRYGFQGQEEDDEIKGEGNSVNYTYRMHDPRIGRFFTVDPLTSKYPYYSPYAFSGNRVIDAVELEGLEPETFIKDNQFTESAKLFYQSALKVSRSSLDNVRWYTLTEYKASNPDPIDLLIVENALSTHGLITISSEAVVYQDSYKRYPIEPFIQYGAHEHTHVMQYLQHGEYGFLVKYAAEVTSMGYRDAPMEVMAYNIEAGMKTWLAGNPEVVERLNTDRSKFNNEQISALDAQITYDGKRFRMEVGIDIEINYWKDYQDVLLKEYGGSTNNFDLDAWHYYDMYQQEIDDLQTEKTQLQQELSTGP